MNSITPYDLLGLLTKHQLLSETALDSVSKEVQRYASIEQFTDDMVQRNWLTAYQQKHILDGQIEKLILGPYRMLEPLGEGGMGVVLKASHVRLDRYVALKLIRPQVLADRPDILSRFHREARAIAQLNHPNVVVLFDADEINGTHFIAMEYVDGQTLEKMVRQSGPMGFKQAADYIRQAALGLQHAHECNLVHRDIKPSNLLVSTKTGRRSSGSLKRPALVTLRDRDNVANGRGRGLDGAWGTLKILDMGLARLQEQLGDTGERAEGFDTLTRAGALLGTPDFIAPEQARDARRVDIRADLYSLGCTLYYILTGRPLFPGGSDVQKLLRHQSEKPFPIEELRPHAPSEISVIFERLVAKKPEDRYQQPIELADALSDYLQRSSPGSSAKVNLPTPVPMSPTEVPPDETPVPMADFPASHDNDAPSPMVGLPQGSSIDMRTVMQPEPKPPVDIPYTAGVKAHPTCVAAVAVSADGRRFASGGLDGWVRIWHLRDGVMEELTALARPGCEIQTLAFAPEEPFLVIGGLMSGTGRVWRWDWNEGRVYEWGTFEGERFGIGGMTFAKDGTHFAAGVGSNVVVWKVNRRNALSRTVLKGHTNPVRTLVFSPDNRLLVSGGEGRTLRFWGFGGWLGPNLKAKVQGHNDIVTSMCYSNDGKKLVTVGLDRVVIIWDPLLPAEETARHLVGHTSGVRLVTCLMDSEHILSIGETGQAILWNSVDGEKLREFELDASVFQNLAVSRDGQWLVGGTSDGHVYVYYLGYAIKTNQSAMQTVSNG